MPDQPVTVVHPAWALAALALLSLVALVSASMARVVLASAAGTSQRQAWRQPVSAAARSMVQRRRTTLSADVLLWRIGGVGLVAVAALMVVVVPLGRWVLADLDIGVVWFNAMDVLVWAAVWLTGWGPNSAFGLVGGYRFLAQALAYELPLMFALIAPATMAGSLRVADVVAAQQGLWFAVWMPVAFLIYLIGVAAFSLQGPFRAARAWDVTGGVETELSGVDALLFRGGRHMVLAAGAAFGAAVFLGGGAGPLLPGWLWLLVKTVALLGVFAWVGARVPLLRPDKFMETGWLVLLPLALAQTLVVAVISVARG